MAVVKVDCKNLKNNPPCLHGPTLKFIRIKNGLLQEFFACSTYRDRKDCSFFLPVNGHKAIDRAIYTLERRKELSKADYLKMDMRLEKVKKAPAVNRFYCHTCCQLDHIDRRDQHRNHTVQLPINDHMISHPSEILKPKDSAKKEAQYLFTKSTSQVIVDNLQRAGVSHVLCLGTPRVHEYIQEATNELHSLLLDFDDRYHSFWPADKFIWFNMFNRFVLSGNTKLAKRALRRFLTAANQVALVMDPPFGGHVEPLAATVRHFTRLVEKLRQGAQLKVIWTFPYFREKHIMEKCPSLTMLDYKVEYENHREFNNGIKGRKLGSPVRLFTNMDPQLFILPQSEGYKLCKACSRWVSAENKHCAKCNSCPSKDGRTYVHCNHCKSCVKPQWQHCAACKKCLPPSHLCAVNDEEVECEEIKHPRHKKLKIITEARRIKSKFKRKAIR